MTDNIGTIRSNEDKEMLRHLFKDKWYPLKSLAEIFWRTEKWIAYRLQYMWLVDNAEEFLKEQSKPEIKESSSTENFEHTLDMEMFKALKIKRLKLAQRINKPAYYICYDYTLEYMAENKPLNREEMMNIPWIKDVKFDWYWEEFIKTIKAVLTYYDNHYFNIKTKRHADDWSFYNKRWFNIDWINKETWTKWDLQWFDIDWNHKETWTKYNPNWYDINWNKDVDPFEEFLKKKAHDDEVRRLLW